MGKKAGKKGAYAKTYSFERFIVSFGRFCAWALLVFIILYFISGFGITKSGLMYQWTGGLMNKALAFQIHEYLTLPMAFAFLAHTLIAIRFAFIRWNVKVKNEKALNYLFLGVGVVLFALAAFAYFA